GAGLEDVERGHVAARLGDGRLGPDPPPRVQDLRHREADVPGVLAAEGQVAELAEPPGRLALGAFAVGGLALGRLARRPPERADVLELAREGARVRHAPEDLGEEAAARLHQLPARALHAGGRDLDLLAAVAREHQRLLERQRHLALSARRPAAGEREPGHPPPRRAGPHTSTHASHGRGVWAPARHLGSAIVAWIPGDRRASRCRRPPRPPRAGARPRAYGRNETPGRPGWSSTPC